MGSLERYFWDLSEAVFRLEKFLLVKIVYLHYESELWKNWSFLLIKKVKIDQFKQTLSDLESSFDELFDTGFKFENIFLF